MPVWMASPWKNELPARAGFLGESWLTSAAQQVQLRGRGSRRKGLGGDRNSKGFTWFSPLRPYLWLPRQEQCGPSTDSGSGRLWRQAALSFLRETFLAFLRPPTSLPTPGIYETSGFCLSPGHLWLSTGDSSGTTNMASIPSRGYPAVRAVWCSGEWEEP